MRRTIGHQQSWVKTAINTDGNGCSPLHAADAVIEVVRDQLRPSPASFPATLTDNFLHAVLEWRDDPCPRQFRFLRPA